MSIDEEQVRADWAAAVGLGDTLDAHPDALTITQLAPILGFRSHKAARRWVERGIAAGTVESHVVYRRAGNGLRRVRVYRIIK